MSTAIWIEISLISLFTVVFVIVVWRTVAHSRISLRKMRFQGITLLLELGRVLNCIQKHRGYTTSQLSGEDDLEELIAMTQLSAMARIDAINSLQQELQKNERWKNVCKHWSRMNSGFRLSDPDNNFFQHTQLIRNILYLMDDVAYEYGLLDMITEKNKAFYHASRGLMELLELLGELRALGSSICSSRHCDTITQVRLQYLKQKTSETMNGMCAKELLSVKETDALKDILETLNTKVCTIPVSIDSKQFFTFVTSSMELLYERFNSMLLQSRDGL